jgi:hemerythrin
MQWADQFIIGIPKIDEQHKELFRQTEILLDRSKVGRIAETIQFLGDYVLKHFIDEQGLQAAVNYPKAEAHKKTHAAFAAKVSELKKRVEESSDDIKFDLATEINRTVIGWLKEHIMGHDMEFGVYYREHSQARQAKRALVAAGSPRGAAGAAVPMVVPTAGTTPRYWRADLATGLPKLDEQHKEIFRRAEILVDRNRAGQIPETLNFLVQYTGRHFGAEENAQVSIGYPGLEAHRKDHAVFTRRFRELKKRFETADQARQAEAAKEAARFLVEWFRTHIMNQDQYFAAHYKKNQRAAGRKKQGFLYRLFHFWSGT